MKNRYPVILLCLASLICFSLPTLAAEPPTDPILRIETGMHTTGIRKMSMDASGRLFATASEDKTVRLWEYENGQLRLLRVPRPPLGEGNEGKLYALAVSPDGETVAAGGWTGVEWDKSSCIYVFNSRTGAITGRITGLLNVSNYLSFSPDGRFLAVSTSGVQLFHINDLTEVGKDTNYADNSFFHTFFTAANGNLKLATTSRDGNLRLYDIANNGSLTLRTKVKGAGGKEPLGIAASPEGRIAVGYVDSTKVDIFSGEDLSPLYSAYTSGINGETINRVAWSPDSSTLYAGGSVSKNSVFAWTEAGKGQRQEIQTGANNGITSIIPLPKGDVLISTSAPAIIFLPPLRR